MTDYTDKTTRTMIGKIDSQLADIVIHPQGLTLDNATDNTTLIQTTIDSSPVGSTIFIPKNCKYEIVNWKGRKHTSNNAPAIINEVTWTGANLNARMCISNGYLFICEYANAKIAIFDLSDKRNPKLISEYNTGYNPRHCYVIDKYLFVCCLGSNQIQIFNIDNIKMSGNEPIYTFATGVAPKHFVIVGKFIYVVCFGSNKLEKYEIVRLNPSNSLICKVGEVTTSSQPLTVSYGKKGVFAVVGLSPNLDLIGETALNLISSTAIGGATHGTCEFVGNNVLVTDNNLGRLISVDVYDLLHPITTSAINISSNPEQIEIVGNKAYIPNFSNTGVTSTLDCIDITDITHPYLYKQIPLNVCGGGFTAVSDNILYVDSHFSPYNIEIIEIENIKYIDNVENNYLQNLILTDGKYDVQNLTVKYRTILSNDTMKVDDYIIRMGGGTSYELLNPSTLDGKMVIIKNVHTSVASTITNPYSNGYQGGTLNAGQSVILVAMGYGGDYQWDLISNT